MRPLGIDLFAGLGGWTDGLLAEGFDVVGFDIERHVYGEHRYPAQLVIQDVLTLHGKQFRGADLIVASPPCQAYSWRAMPWKAAKAAPPPDNSLFNACFRIQREASEAAGRHVPMVVENVRGAQKWVGRARWNFGSFYLWGDVPALMPETIRAAKVGSLGWSEYAKTGVKSKGFNTTADQIVHGRKNTGGSWFNVAHNTTSGTGRNPDGRKQNREILNKAGHNIILPQVVNREADDGIKQSGISGPRANGKGDRWFQDGAAAHGSKSSARKFASAMIAKIPLVLSRHIAATYRPAGKGGVS